MKRSKEKAEEGGGKGQGRSGTSTNGGKEGEERSMTIRAD